MSSTEKKRILAAVFVLWVAAVVGAKVFEILGLLDLSGVPGRVWWLALLLLGTALLGAVFQPLVKEYFPKRNHGAVAAEPALLLKDYETMAGYYPAALASALLGTLFLSPLFFGSQIFFVLRNAEIFWWAALGSGVLNVFIFYFMTKAYRYGDLSLVSGTWALTPVFMVPLSFVVYAVLGPHAFLTSPALAPLGLLGIILVVASLLFLVSVGRGQSTQDTAPENDWFARYPVVSGVAGSLIAALAINLDKVAVESGNPFLAAVVVTSTVAAMTGAWTLLSGGFARISFIFRRYRKQFFALGAVYGAVLLIMSLTLFGENVNYQGTIKRLSIVFAALYGVWVLGEGGSLQNKLLRVLLAALAFVGVVVIALFG